MIKYLSQIKNKDIKGDVFLVRIDTNVSIKDGRVENDFRLRSVKQTVEFLLNKEAKVVLIGHREPAPESSIEHVADYYKKFFPTSFVDSCDPDEVRGYIEKLKNGNVIVLENLRSLPFEKDNDQNYARSLSSLADFYVNDAFSVSHREHASTVGVPRFIPSFAGMCFEREIKELTKTFSPQRPFLFILGGLKFKTKAPLIEKFVEKADTVFIGGALANSFFKQKGYEVGMSATDDGVDLKDLITKDNLVLPSDVVVENKEEGRVIKNVKDVSLQDSIVDVGPSFINKLSEEIKKSAFVVWNGPMGNVEEGYDQHTKELAKNISLSKTYSVIGGGDTISSIEDIKPEECFSFVSTGGGAMLDFLVNETLPGIKALENSPEVSF